jgi:hypothetical protein
MQRSRYKYVSSLDHAKCFQQGKMFCRTAAYYRDYEDKTAAEVIGDQYEGARLFRPLDGLQVNNLTQGTRGVLNAGMECITRAHEIYVFCLSLSLNDILKKEFNAVACVEIYDPAELHARWLKALPDEVKHHVSEGPGDYAKHVSRKVSYYTPQDLLGPVWALPDMITTGKLKRFEYQDEYRFAYTKTDAFKFENCTYSIVNRKARPEPKPHEHLDETLNLGDLRDICRIQVF